MAKKKKDYYEELGVSSKATKAQIKAAYRSKAKSLHPDTYTGDEEAFIKLNQAYKVLIDDTSRKLYDRGDTEVIDLRLALYGDSLSLIYSMLNAVIDNAQAITEATQVLDIMTDTISDELKKLRSSRKKLHCEINCVKLVKSRFYSKRHKDKNILDHMFDQLKKMRTMKRQQVTHKIALHMMALRTLKNFSYAADADEDQPCKFTFSEVMKQAMKNRQAWSQTEAGML
jgi:curved DNA-binding protein CbpA